MYLIKTKDGILQRPYSKIEYIENANRRLAVHLVDGEALKSLFIRKCFEDEIKDVVAKPNFLQIHKSFLINLDYVKQLTPNNVVMESGIRLPVSKARAANVKREYLIYISDKYR